MPFFIYVINVLKRVRQCDKLLAGKTEVINSFPYHQFRHGVDVCLYDDRALQSFTYPCFVAAFDFPSVFLQIFFESTHFHTTFHMQLQTLIEVLYRILKVSTCSGKV